MRNSTSPTIELRYQAFHRNNPHVYDRLRQLAMEWMFTHGKGKLSIKMLFEVARWDSAMETKDVTRFKLNNNYHSRYARDLMTNETALAGVFNTRKLKTTRYTL